MPSGGILLRQLAARRGPGRNFGTELQEGNVLNKRVLVVAVFALVLTLAIGAMASAQSRVAVIDLAFIIDESQAGQQGNAILQEAIAERQQQVSEMEEQLIAMETALADPSLSDAERTRMLGELEAAAGEFSQTVARLEAELEELLQVLRSQIVQDIRIVVEMVAAERDIDLVIDANQAYFFRSTVDLTSDVLALYDELFEASRAADEGP